MDLSRDIHPLTDVTRPAGEAGAMTSEELAQRVADWDTDIESLRRDYVRAVLEMIRITQDETMPTAEKIERLRHFGDNFQVTPRRAEVRRGQKG